jgi:uncharacterized FlaG/YvyC family protein
LQFLQIEKRVLAWISCFFEKDGVIWLPRYQVSVLVAQLQRQVACLLLRLRFIQLQFKLHQQPKNLMCLCLKNQLSLYRSELQFNAAESRKNLQEAVSMLNEQVASHKNGLGFSISDHIDVPVVTVKNTVTGEVVRQIPNEVVIRVARNIDTVQKGLLHNSKV